MQNISRLLAIVLVAAALAGCANGGDDKTTTPTSTGTTPTTSATPTPTSTVPTVTPPSVPVTPTTPVGGIVAASVSRVYVVSSPEHAANGTNADVCWRVEGTGTITHTALHFDTASHPDGDFAAYRDAVYPNNGPAVGQHKLPGVFCAKIGPISGTVYYKAHGMVDPAHSAVSTEETIIAGSGNNTADLIGAPEVFPAGLSYNFCWEIPGLTGTSPHTAIHWDTVSHPTGGFEAYANASYPNNGAATTTGSFALPGPFCANITMPTSGTLYLRAHALANGASYLGPERSVVVAPRVAVSGGLPATAAAGSKVNVCWRAESSGTSPHTALHFDTASHPNATSFTDYADAVYPNNGPATTSGTFALPGPFCADLTMPPSGTLYFRPHAIYPAPGGQELGPEYSIRVG